MRRRCGADPGRGARPLTIDLERLRILAGAQTLRLALPQEMIALYPDCEEGAMPPFGELHSHRVFADEKPGLDC